MLMSPQRRPLMAASYSIFIEKTRRRRRESEARVRNAACVLAIKCNLDRDPFSRIRATGLASFLLILSLSQQKYPRWGSPRLDASEKLVCNCSE